MIVLRPYQQQAVEAAAEHLGAHGTTLIVCPTGTGKTLICADLIRRRLSGGRAMVIAHREELLAQARDKIELVTGIRPDLEMADSRAADGMFQSPIVASSIQTQMSGRNGMRRMHGFRPADFHTLIYDEAHHSIADSGRLLIDYYRQNPALGALGVTATPDRLDEKALGQIFRTVAFEYQIVDAIREGWLVPVKQQYLSVEVNLDGVRTTLGDLNGADLRAALAVGHTLEQIASDAVQFAGDRRTLVFADSCENAERLTEAFNRHRLGCGRIITGETPRDERRGIVAAYRAGAFQYLINVGIASEGFDVPEIACVVMARPTCSRALYCQQAGRGTRPLSGLVDGLANEADRRAAIAASGKPDLLLLDVVGVSSRHKLVGPADLLGGNYSDEVVALADGAMLSAGRPVDVLEALEQAQRLHNAQIEAAAAAKAKLALRPRSGARDVDPFGVLGLTRGARRGWDLDEKPSNLQREKLERWGIDGIGNLNATGAEQIIREFQSRTRRGLATYKQSRVLVSRWYMPPEQARNTTFAEARRIIDILAANKWRKPKGA